MTTLVVGQGVVSHAKTMIGVPHTDNCYDLIYLLDPKPELYGKSVLGIPLDTPALFAEWRR